MELPFAFTPTLPSRSAEGLGITQGRPLARLRAGLGGFWLVATISTALMGAEPEASPPGTASPRLAPVALEVSADGSRLFVAGAAAHRIDTFDLAEAKSGPGTPMPAAPSGLVISADGRRLFVTCGGAKGRVCEVDLASGAVSTWKSRGHTPVAPVLSPDGTALCVCLRYENQVAVFDVPSRKELRRITVGREPVSAAFAPDGRRLLVAHHLPSGRADAPVVAATVGVVDLNLGTMAKELRLPNGSGLLREIRVSPDGRYAVVAHNLARYQMPTTQLERGWMNTSALSLIDLERLDVRETILLDQVDHGAANPWAVRWANDGKRVVVSHAGTHELSVIDFPAVLAKLASAPASPPNGSYSRPAPSEDLSFLLGMRERLPLRGNGPRALAVAGSRVVVAEFFSDSLEVLTLDQAGAKPESGWLRPPSPLPEEVRGEMVFNDASYCFQGWQSCASCHSDDARVDGFNWDLLNDGLGNPKNSKSLLLSHVTPPAMSGGVRETAEAAVRAGIRHIMFAVPSDALAASMDTWLKGLRPLPSPCLDNGKLSAAAKRGQRIFESEAAGCSTCHPSGLFTDLREYDVGTAGSLDRPNQEFDTPTLIEIWRTAPYLHDGSAASLLEVLTERNSKDQHGRTSHLSATQRSDLVAYLLSL